MFVRLYADNYRCFSAFTLELSSLSVLLGSNGSGKSTILTLFAKLRDFLTGRGKSLDLFPPETLCRWDKRIEQTFELVVKLEDYGEYVYRLCIRHEAPERALNKVVQETLSLNGKPLFEGNDQEIRLHNDWQSGSPVGMQPDWHVSGVSRVYARNDNKKLIAFRKAFENMLVLQLNPALVNAVAEGKQAVEIPMPNCSDFAGWLRHISSAEALIRSLAEQRLAWGSLPGFLVFQADPSGDAEVLECIFKAKPKPLKFRLDELSSGQIALIILEVAVAAATERGGALLLDEPSNFLGLPEIQPLLVRLQDAALEGRFQVLLTAHHPIAVDLLAAGHGLWLEREPTGPARVHRLQMTDSAADDKSAMRVSDLIARGWVSALGISRPATPEETGSAAAVQ
ncbi:MAG: AAA family ATPase [Verrucomicrobiota bacterium]|jgi:predicted ATPase